MVVPCQGPPVGSYLLGSKSTAGLISEARNNETQHLARALGGNTSLQKFYQFRARGRGEYNEAELQTDLQQMLPPFLAICYDPVPRGRGSAVSRCRMNFLAAEVLPKGSTYLL